MSGPVETVETVGVEEIRSLVLFKDLDDAELALIQRVTRAWCPRPDGPPICREGDRGDGLYIVLDGEVEVFKTDTRGKRHLLGRMSPGDFFGEMALLENKPRSATAVATRPTRLLFLGRAEFSQMSGPLAQVLCKVLLRMLAGMSSRLCNVGERFVTAKACLEAFRGL
jgi:CRP-like cAMP-binding protein